ncbi:MAG: DNA methyltransferase, partial [Burkholderiaceae bacterium]
MATPSPDAAAAAFIERWRAVPQLPGATELATAQSFVSELCELLDLPRPHPTVEQDYQFERPVTFAHGDGSSSAGRIDCYRRGAFVLEAKKLRSAEGKGFDDALLRARSQAEQYARALPAVEGRPPFLLVVDVGRVIELYAEFSRSGATYTPYPDPRSHRLRLEDLARAEVRERLRAVWLDPASLDPAKRSARVTRALAEKLARVARALETRHPPQWVADFLSRCLFSLFAEDIGLLPRRSFGHLLETHRARPAVLARMMEELWTAMDTGGFSAALAEDVLRFNGKFFKDRRALELRDEEIAQLIAAARSDWREVEPAIFGTLLERALDPAERHALGAHYTPRAYVERLVLPTVIEPLRADWANAHAAALVLAQEGKLEAAADTVRGFLHQLTHVRVLDPACGSANFLYVTLEHLKRLEGEVLNALDELGDTRGRLDLEGASVDPHQLLGIELNPRAAAIAEMVLWIGYLQWHYRVRGNVQPPLPVLRDFHNIENRDAVLAWDDVEPATDESGQILTRWDGLTTRAHPVTGEPVPDESAQRVVEHYLNPRPAEWPAADFVVGNPPFIGAATLRGALGDGYVEALRGAWPTVPESADLVMYWWEHAAELTRAAKLRRFGFITTNSLRQTFNRRVVARHLEATPPLALRFAIPDHPWVDSADGAAVRIAMTVGDTSAAAGQLKLVREETLAADGEVSVGLTENEGVIHADLRVGANVAS